MVDAYCAIQSGGPQRNHFELGQLHRQNSSLSKAYYHYCQALSTNPSNPELNYKIALILHEFQEWNLAEEHYRAVISAYSECDARVYFNWGLLNHQRGRYSLAEVCYEQAIAIKPDYFTAYLNLGSVLLLMERGAEAIALYQGLLEQFPNSAMLHNKLGYAFQQHDDNAAAALSHYQTALRLEPTLSLAHHHLGQLWFQQGDRVKAAQYFYESARLSPSLRTLGDLAAVLLSQGNVGDALAALKQAISNVPDLIEAYCQNAFAQTSNSKLSQSRRACANFLQSLQLNDSVENTALTQEWLFQIYCHSGAIAYESRNFRRAETLYHHALNLKPNEHELCKQLANCLNQQDRKIAATLVSSGHNSVFTASQPVYSSQSSQCGVTCPSCMGELIQSFHPEPLAKGLFRIRFNSAPSFATPKREVKFVSQGCAWVSPHESDWAACSEIVVTSAFGEVIPTVSRSYPWRLPNCPNVSQPTLAKYSNGAEIKKVSGKVVLLSTLSGHIYYHWMIDLLPRLGILQQQGASLEEVDWFVVNSLNASFQRETLVQLGVPLEKVLESDQFPHIQADELIVPTFPGHLDWIPPETIDFLRTHFLAPLDSDRTKQNEPNLSHKQIYISRKRARYRHVLNEADVEATLKPLGFKTIFLEELTIKEQAKCFNEAEIIVSAHGSGLTNLVFCQPNTIIIELFAPRYSRTDYWMISQYLNLQHYYTLSRAVACPPLQDLMYQSPLTEDIYVEISTLRAALRVAHIS